MSSIVLLWLLNGSKFVHIIAANGVGPYGLVQNAHQLTLGIIYVVLGLLTNFGANPATVTTLLRGIPRAALNQLFTLSGLTYVVNLVVLGSGVLVGAGLFHASFAGKESKKYRFDNPSKLAMMLVWSAATAIGLFVISDHYYAVDARYLTITLFALFTGLAVYTRTRQWAVRPIVVVAVVVLLSIGFGVFGTVHMYQTSRTALTDINQRNSIVAQVLTNHHVDALVGDYWRVVPIKQLEPIKNQLDIMPLANCTEARNILSSQTWQVDLRHKRFALLLTVDGTLTDFPDCSLRQVIAKYGRPNTSVLITGSLKRPD